MHPVSHHAERERHQSSTQTDMCNYSFHFHNLIAVRLRSSDIRRIKWWVRGGEGATISFSFLLSNCEDPDFIQCVSRFVCQQAAAMLIKNMGSLKDTGEQVCVCMYVTAAALLFNYIVLFTWISSLGQLTQCSRGEGGGVVITETVEGRGVLGNEYRSMYLFYIPLIYWEQRTTSGNKTNALFPATIAEVLK